MSILDQVLKRLVIDEASDFAAWLLQREVVSVEPLPLDLPAETQAVDALFRVQTADGRRGLLHLEFQGRRSHRPMPERMLEYLIRIHREYEPPMRSVVLYLEPGAGREDGGQHEYLGFDGEAVLAWHYQVVHLWQMNAADLLALGRPSLLPLAGLVRLPQPEETLAQIVAAIQSHGDEHIQAQRLAQLLALARDEEITAMIEKMLTEEELDELEELQTFPYLWKQYLRGLDQGKAEGLVEGKTAGLVEGKTAGLAEGKTAGLAEGKAVGLAEGKRDAILDVITERFNPVASDYRRVAAALNRIQDVDRLGELLRLSVRSASLADFEQGLATHAG